MSGPSLSAQPRRVMEGVGSVGGTQQSAGLWLIGLVLGGVAAAGPASNAPFFINPSDWAVYEKQLEFFTRVVYSTGDVDPAVTVYSSLFPVAESYGPSTSGGGPTAVTLGPEVAGSRSPSYTSSAKAISAEQDSGMFTLSAAGLYVIGVTLNATPPSFSRLNIYWTILTVSR